MKNFLLFIVFLLSLKFVSQNQTKKWYFGNQAGLDFATNPPTSLSNSAMSAFEGCASISDATGNLLFYTNGVNIWNQSHVIMANGSNIGGSFSATQSALIVQKPGSNAEYFVFTMGIGGGLIGLKYTIIDMSLAAGMGSVTTKNNNVVIPNVPWSEKITGTKHCNGIDYWIVTHDVFSKTFYSFALTSAGLNTVAVTSVVGQDTIGVYGYMKISPNGKKIAHTGKRNTCVVHDFDNSTGAVSANFIEMTNANPNTIYSSYGLEFSQDCSKLYVSDCNLNSYSPYGLYQWNLCAGSDQAIIASRVVLYSETNLPFSNSFGGALQLAQNGKIYRVRAYIDTLGVINNPNLSGVACNYVHSGQAVAPKTNLYGLPNFVGSFFNPPPSPFVYTKNCRTVSFAAFGTPTCSAINYPVISNVWSFGDPASGAANTSTVLNDVHVYQSGGTYTAQLILNYACRADTLRQVITIPTTLPTFTTSGKLAICKNQTSTLSAVGSVSQGVLSYTWSPVNFTTSLVSVSPSVTTVYTVTGKDLNGCSATKTIQVTVNPCTGIDEQNYGDALSIYPNPSDGKFYVETNVNIDYKLYNQWGIQVGKGFIESPQQAIDLGVLPDGIYFITLNYGKNEKVRKLVKAN